MSNAHLKGFNYAEYLKRHLLVGEIDPWRKDSEGNKFYAVLVPLEAALAECSEWSGQDIGRKEFISYLKLNNIQVFNNIDEFGKFKEKSDVDRKAIKKNEKEVKARHKRIISEETRKKRSERMRLLNASKISPETPLTPH
jgi:hypothetical protein